MAEVQSLTAEPRSASGTGATRALRRTGKVPGVVYGAGQATMHIALRSDELLREIHKRGFFQHLRDLKVDGQTYRVLPRDVQFHPVTDAPLHADFQVVTAGARVRVSVAVQFINEALSPGLKRGGVINTVRREIEVTCPATAIPEAIVVDLTGLDIGSSVHISHVALPEGVRPTITDRDFTIAAIAPPTVHVVEAPVVEAVEGEAAPAEGEGETAAEPMSAS